MKSLNVIGGGKVGRALARLWHDHAVFDIQDILNREPSSASAATRFIGAGRAVGDLREMRAGDVAMLSVPDDKINECAGALARSGLIEPGCVVFHVSGARGSDELDPVRDRGACAASVHPLTSFGDPDRSVRLFPGTCCAAEGDVRALEVLGPAFEAVGGSMVTIDSAAKTVYHAASVTVSNYLAALIEVGLRTYARAGIDRATALHMCEPLVRAAVDNVFELGTARALTGPIVRGDAGTVASHVDALDALGTDTGALYRQLGRVALDLARSRDTLSPDALRKLESVLETANGEPVPADR